MLCFSIQLNSLDFGWNCPKYQLSKCIELNIIGGKQGIHFIKYQGIPSTSRIGQQQGKNGLWIL
jgi:hypothetical protein